MDDTMLRRALLAGTGPDSLYGDEFAPPSRPNNKVTARKMMDAMPVLRQPAGSVGEDMLKGFGSGAMTGLLGEDLTRSIMRDDPYQPSTLPGKFAGVGAALAATLLGGPRAAAAKELEAAGSAAKGIRAYHGSPHDFDKFDISKIGTGEGAQAYGHGLYFAENEKVAKEYRDALAGGQFIVGGQPYDPSNLTHVAANTVFTTGRGSPEKAIAALKMQIAQNRRINASWKKDSIAADEAVIKRIEQGGLPPVEAVSGGKMYEVNIAADPEHFLDWDKPVKDQADVLRNFQHSNNSRRYIAGENPTSASRAPTGGDMYNELLQRNPAALREAGIPGIKYLDQGSRPDMARVRELRDAAAKHTAVGEHEYAAEATKLADSIENSGTRNYVVFDPAIVTILRKYGLPITAANVGMAAALLNSGGEARADTGAAP